jgi:hypothetical protein
MAECSCCLTLGSQVIIGEADIGKYTVSVNVDTSRDVQWDSISDKGCETPENGPMIYKYGPGKATLQLTAYPFSIEDEYNLGFTCPMEVNVQIPWRYVFDCRQCVDCVNPRTGLPAGKVRGRWVGIGNKKKVVTVTGDVESSAAKRLFNFSGCPTPIAKFTLQAGANVAIVTQPSMQFFDMEYFGLPVAFNTMDMSKIWDLTVRTGQACSWVTGFSNVKAYLTGFTFNYQPPNVPTVTYNFDAMITYCPDC